MDETKKKKRNFAITVMLIIMTFALCITLFSCGGDEAIKDENNKAKTEQSADVIAEEKGVANKEAISQKTETQKASEKATEKETQAAEQSKKVCYITIEGYCSGKEISLQGGDTVYSILCRSGARVSGSGNYIKGINGRFEFDEGPSSGWVYYVNGSKPSVGCGNCSVKAGDDIRWNYVTGY